MTHTQLKDKIQAYLNSNPAELGNVPELVITMEEYLKLDARAANFLQEESRLLIKIQSGIANKQLDVQLLPALTARKEKIGVPVPREIHFEFFTKLSAIDIERIGLWLQVNGRGKNAYRINVWYDSSASLAEELVVLIKEKVAESMMAYRHHNPNSDALIQSNAEAKYLDQHQQHAYLAIEKSMKHGIAFDDAALMYLKKHTKQALVAGIEQHRANYTKNFQEALEAVKTRFPDLAENLRLQDMYNLFSKPKHQNNYLTYAKELTLRILATDSNALSRLTILTEHGGIAVANAAFPIYNKELFKAFPDTSAIKQTIARLILEQDAYRNIMPEYTRITQAERQQVGFKDSIQSVTDGEIQAITGIIQDPANTDKLLLSLDTLHADPATGYIRSGNAIVASTQGSPFIEQVFIRRNHFNQLIVSYQSKLAQINSFSDSASSDGSASSDDAYDVSHSNDPRKAYLIQELNKNTQKVLKKLGINTSVIPEGSAASLMYILLRERRNLARDIVSPMFSYQERFIYLSLLNQNPQNVIQVHPTAIQDLNHPPFLFVSFVKEIGNRALIKFQKETRYDRHFILVQNDPTARLVAPNLLKKHPISTMVVYNHDGAIIEIQAQGKLPQAGKTRVTIINHGEQGSMPSEPALLNLLKQTPGLATANGDITIDRLRFVSCGLTNYANYADPNYHQIERERRNGYLDSAYKFLDQEGIEIGGIRAYSEQVTISPDGSIRAIVFASDADAHLPADQRATKYVFASESDLSVLMTPVRDINGNLRSIDVQGIPYNKSFFERYVQPYAPGFTRIEQDVFPLLAGSSSNTYAVRSFLAAHKKGDVLLLNANDGMTVLAMMNDSNHQIIISDPSADRSSFVNRIMIGVLITHPTYTDWLNSLGLSTPDKIAFDVLIRLHHHDVESAYLRMRGKIINNEIYLTNTNLAAPLISFSGKVTFPYRLNQDPLAGIWLGDIETQVFDSRVFTTIDPTKVVNNLSNLEANLTRVSSGEKSSRVASGKESPALTNHKTNTPIYGYSTITGEHIAVSTKDPKLQKRFSRYAYLNRILKAIDYGTLSSPTSEQITLHKAAQNLQQIDLSIKTTNNISTKDWTMQPSSLHYDRNKQQYTIAYINPKTKQTKTLTTQNDTLHQSTRILNQNNQAIQEGVSISSRGIYPRLSHTSGKVMNSLGRLLMLQSIFDMLEANASTLTSALQTQLFVSQISTVINISDESMGIIVSKFASKTGKLARLTSKLSIGMSAIGIALDTYDLYLSIALFKKAATDQEQLMLNLNIGFSSLSLTLSVFGMVAMLAGASGIGLAIGAIGLIIGLMANFISNEIMAAVNNPKTRAAAIAFLERRKEGFKKGGFYLEDSILCPYEGVVLKTIDLSKPVPSVEFDPEGLRIRRVNSNYQPISTMGKVGGYEVVGDRDYVSQLAENKNISTQKIIEFPNNDHLINLILPSTYKATIDFTYSNAIFSTGMIGIEISEAMGRTETAVYLGNKIYRLLVPGSDLQQNNHAEAELYWKTFGNIHHVIYAPEAGESTIILGMNKGQGWLSLMRTNPKVTWILDLRNFDSYEFNLEKINRGEQKGMFLLSVDYLKSEYLPQFKTWTQGFGNKIAVHQAILQQGITIYSKRTLGEQLTLKNNALHVVPTHINLASITGANAAQTVIAQHASKFKETQIIIENLLLYNNRKITSTLFRKKDTKILCTQWSSDTLFSGNTIFTNDTLIYENGISAWYQGDIVGNGHTYKDVVWKSKITTGKLEQVYLPIGHYPEEIGRPQSIIQRAEPYEKGIALRQLLTYISGGKKVKEYFTYLIDTQTNPRVFTLIEAQGVKRYQSIESIYNWMQRWNKGKHLVLSALGLKLDSVKGTGLNVVKVSIPHPRTIIYLENFRTIFPEKNWYGDLTGELAPVLPADLKDNNSKIIDINQTDYQLNLIGCIKGDRHTKDIYFWQVLKKTGKYELVTLFIDDRNEGSKIVDLASFGITHSQVQNMAATSDGCLIFTQKATYHVSVDQELTLKALNHIWETKIPWGNGKTLWTAYGSWVKSIQSTIEQLSTQQAKFSLFPPKKKAHKVIHIDPLITIAGLKHSYPHYVDIGQSKPKQRLLAWYDSVNNLFFVTEEKDKQQFSCLGITNDGKGAWIVDHQIKNNALLYYLPAMDANLLAKVLDKGTLIKGKEGTLPRKHVIDLDEEILKADYSVDGSLRVKTAKGLILNIALSSATSKTEKPLLMLRLEYVHGSSFLANSAYPNRPRSEADTQKLFLELQDTKKYHFAEMVPFSYGTNLSIGWYHANTRNIFIPEHLKGEKIKYLGYRQDNQSAYFTANLTNILQKQIGKRTLRLVDCTYRREQNLLILTADLINQPGMYLNIHGEITLLINNTQAQKTDRIFTFQLNKFTYSIVHLLHRGRGSMVCGIDVESALIVRMGTQLQIRMLNQLLIIEDAFDDKQNMMHGRLIIQVADHKFAIANLVQWYTEKQGDGKGWYRIFLLTDYLAHIASTADLWLLSGNVLQ